MQPIAGTMKQSSCCTICPCSRHLRFAQSNPPDHLVQAQRHVDQADVVERDAASKEGADGCEALPLLPQLCLMDPPVVSQVVGKQRQEAKAHVCRGQHEGKPEAVHTQGPPIIQAGTGLGVSSE